MVSLVCIPTQERGNESNNMTASDIDKAKKPREQAIIHNTQLIIWRDNRVVKLSPDEICEQVVDYRVDK